MDKWIMCVVALLLGMLMFHMLKNVCGCKTVEGNSDNGIDTSDAIEAAQDEACKMYKGSDLKSCICNSVGDAEDIQGCVSDIAELTEDADLTLLGNTLDEFGAGEVIDVLGTLAGGGILIDAYENCKGSSEISMKQILSIANNCKSSV